MWSVWENNFVFIKTGIRKKKGAKSFESAPNPCNQISILLDADPELICSNIKNLYFDSINFFNSGNAASTTAFIAFKADSSS